ncbi:uncharacterized protein LOC118350371 isoform X1 [Canis lupus dingo]|nr:uncharacterized protein LOC118350371 isoform X1 [Canis lupus dingo]
MGRRRPAECQAGSANERAPAQVAPPSPPRLEPPSGRWGLGQSPPPRPRRGRASRPPGIRGIHPPRGVCPGGREQVRARSPWEPPAPGGEPTGATPESESPAGTRGPPTGAGTAPGRPEDGPGMNCGKNQEDSSESFGRSGSSLIHGFFEDIPSSWKDVLKAASSSEKYYWKRRQNKKSTEPWDRKKYVIFN